MYLLRQLQIIELIFTSEKETLDVIGFNPVLKPVQLGFALIHCGRAVRASLRLISPLSTDAALYL